MVKPAKVLTTRRDGKHVNAKKLQARALPSSCKRTVGKLGTPAAAQKPIADRLACRIKIHLKLTPHEPRALPDIYTVSCFRTCSSKQCVMSIPAVHSIPTFPDVATEMAKCFQGSEDMSWSHAVTLDDTKLGTPPPPPPGGSPYNSQW